MGDHAEAEEEQHVLHLANGRYEQLPDEWGAVAHRVFPLVCLDAGEFSGLGTAWLLAYAGDSMILATAEHVISAAANAPATQVFASIPVRPEETRDVTHRSLVPLGSIGTVNHFSDVALLRADINEAIHPILHRPAQLPIDIWRDPVGSVRCL